MSNNSLFIHLEHPDGSYQWTARFVSGFPASFKISEEIPSSRLIEIVSLKKDGNKSTLQEGQVYFLYKKIANSLVQIASFHITRFLSDKLDIQRYMVTIGESDIHSLQIIEAWEDGASFNWRELDSCYAEGWIRACRMLASPKNWVQSIASNQTISINSKNLRSRNDFFCMLGEAFFGYKGYAGSNLDALFDVLRANNLSTTATIEGPTELSKLLFQFTENIDYLKLFKDVLIQSGVNVLEVD